VRRFSGGFYETFGEDAVRAAKILGITLTKLRGIRAKRLWLVFRIILLALICPNWSKQGFAWPICDQRRSMTKTIVNEVFTELVTQEFQ
jgi:DNA mismatch repair protein MutS